MFIQLIQTHVIRIRNEKILLGITVDETDHLEITRLVASRFAREVNLCLQSLMDAVLTDENLVLRA